MNRRFVAIAETSAVVLASSLVVVLAKLALADVPAFTFVWLQIGIGGVLLTLYTFWLRGERIPKGLGRRVWIHLSWIGVCNFTVVRVLLMLALGRLPATTNAYLVNFVGIVTMLMSVLLLKEWPSVVQVLGAIVALAGLRVFFPDTPPPAELTGVAYLAIGVGTLALTNNLARRLWIVERGGLSSNVASTVALWIGGIPVVLAGVFFDWPPPVAGVRSWSIIALSAIVSIAVGLTVWNHVLRTLRSYEASVLGASSVIFTALFAVPILGERLAPHQLLGIAMMLAGVILVQVRRGLRRAPPGTGTMRE